MLVVVGGSRGGEGLRHIRGEGNRSGGRMGGESVKSDCLQRLRQSKRRRERGGWREEEEEEEKRG